MPRAYYNEHDPHAAAWLENLVAANVIAPGDVDTRDIRDVRPSDLDGYTQCHFFAGIGCWSGALRAAGWPDDRPVWTGSCPCQPFSAAGARLGLDDERHLWPDWQWLIEQCRPQVLFGEQVASADGLVWADLVSDDLEATGYTAGFVDTCAAGFASFHIRQRLYFVAEDLRPSSGGVAKPNHESERGRLGEEGSAARSSQGEARGQDWQWPGPEHGGGGAAVRLDDTPSARHQPPRQGPEGEARDQTWLCGSERGCGDMRLADSKVCQRRLPEGQDWREVPQSIWGSEDLRTDPADGYWRDADWLFCRDGFWRAVEPGTFPLAHASPARMGRLRAYGNGLDLAQATGFVRAYLERDVADAKHFAGDLFERVMMEGTP